MANFVLSLSEYISKLSSVEIIERANKVDMGFLASISKIAIHVSTNPKTRAFIHAFIRDDNEDWRTDADANENGLHYDIGQDSIEHDA